MKKIYLILLSLLVPVAAIPQSHPIDPIISPSGTMEHIFAYGLSNKIATQAYVLYPPIAAFARKIIFNPILDRSNIGITLKQAVPIILHRASIDIEATQKATIGSYNCSGCFNFEFVKTKEQARILTQEDRNRGYNDDWTIVVGFNPDSPVRRCKCENPFRIKRDDDPKDTIIREEQENWTNWDVWGCAIDFDISSVTPTWLDGQVFEYTGQPIEPKIKLTKEFNMINEKYPMWIELDDTVRRTLIEGEDYTLKYYDNLHAGIGTISILPIQPYYTGDSLILHFPIRNPLNRFDSYTIEPIPPQTYTGEPITPPLSISIASSNLLENEYTATYSSNVNAGIASVKIEGGYKDKVLNTTAYFKIKPMVVKAITLVLPIEGKKYTGEEIHQTVGILVAPKENPIWGFGEGYGLVENRDYTVRYANNIEAGMATIFITVHFPVNGNFVLDRSLADYNNSYEIVEQFPIVKEEETALQEEAKNLLKEEEADNTWTPASEKVAEHPTDSITPQVLYSKDKFTFHEMKGYKATIYNIEATVHLQIEIPNNLFEYAIKGKLPEGAYLLCAEKQGKRIVQKFIVE